MPHRVLERYVLRYDRRAGSGDRLRDAFLQAEDELCFDDLVVLVPDADAGEIAAWLGHAVLEGLIEELPATNGSPRCYRVRARGRRVMGLRRRTE